MSNLPLGTLIEGQYKIISSLGKGGFGQAYLAEDTRRFGEKVVLKQLIAQGGNLQKAKELFNREAQTLYRLKHPQIPEFLGLIEDTNNNQLFLAQSYISGQSYLQLLSNKTKFSEPEIIDFLQKILPVLEYIHRQNPAIIHRDISPDNIILSDQTNLPILIDFGAVKVGVNQVTTYLGKIPTVIGKTGFAPPEQMGLKPIVFPSSDLYALAITCLVLLTASNPGEFYDSHNNCWTWKSMTNLSPRLNQIFEKMLDFSPSHRYDSATEVLKELNQLTPQIPVNTTQPATIQNTITPTQLSVDPTFNPNGSTKVVSPGTHVRPDYSGVSSNVTYSPTVTPPNSSSGSVSSPSYSSTSHQKNYFKTAIIFGLVLVIPGFLAFTGIKSYLKNHPLIKKEEVNTKKTEDQRQQDIQQRIKSLNLKESSFYKEVDAIFHSRHPELQGRALKTSFEDTKLREEWLSIAEELLDKKEGK